MIDDLIVENHSRVNIFKHYAASVKESPWTGFFNLLTRNDGFIVNQVLLNMTLFYSLPWYKSDLEV